ncbi:MAG: tetratricopeptide repeat protein [Phycisphaerae bacterium]
MDGLRAHSVGRRAGSDRGFVRLGYGRGIIADGGRLGHRVGRRGHGTSASLALGLDIRLGHWGGHYYRDHWWRGGYNALAYYHRYRGYRRCYGSIYAGYGPIYYRYFGFPDYYSYYPYSTVIDYPYQPLLSPVHDTTIIYAQGSQSAPPPAAEAYISAPAQPQPVDPGEANDVELPQPSPASQTAAGAATSATDAGEVTPWTELGATAFAAGRYDEARYLYMRAVLADDGDGYAKLFYGLANFAAGEYGAAATAVRRALEAIPDLIDDPIDLRALYPDESVLTMQLGQLGELVQANPGDREARFLLGYLYYATAKPQEALQLLQSAADGDPDDALAAFVRDAAQRVVNRQTPTNDP